MLGEGGGCTVDGRVGGYLSLGCVGAAGRGEGVGAWWGFAGQRLGLDLDNGGGGAGGAGSERHGRPGGEGGGSTAGSERDGWPSWSSGAECGAEGLWSSWVAGLGGVAQGHRQGRWLEAGLLGLPAGCELCDGLPWTCHWYQLRVGDGVDCWSLEWLDDRVGGDR